MSIFEEYGALKQVKQKALSEMGKKMVVAFAMP